jgi:hypothetical protein
MALEFKVVVAGDPNNVVTEVYKINPAKQIRQGYLGTEYIRVGGWINQSKTLIGTLKGTLTYSEEREWNNVFG